MEILGIGASELIFILIIAIIVLGPKDMQKAGRTIGRWLNQLIQSDSWKVFQKTSTELRNLPRNLMREANMELKDLQAVDKEIRRTIDPRQYPSATDSTPGRLSNAPPSSKTDSGPQPPASTSPDANTNTEQDD